MSHRKPRTSRDAEWLKRVGVRAEDAPQEFADIDGKTWRVPQIRRRPPKITPVFVALRRTVMARDNFTCCGCKRHADEVSSDGCYPYITEPARRPWRDARTVTRLIILDHILSLRNGGSWHPDNLQALCEACNSAKSTYVDNWRPE